MDTMSVCVCGCEKEVLQDKRKREREEVKINQHHIMQRMYTKKWCGLKKESGMIRKIRKKGKPKRKMRMRRMKHDDEPLTTMNV